MKHSKNEGGRHNRQQPNSNAIRPDIRDNLDSRKNEEQDDKGSHTTHHRKDTKADKHKRK
ncbi:hypothetical protein [Chitinophaga nivalis]|uniref:Uncharacterized protein n=1 Tax=Chitinophaga nivalis TaxID=2991709 RepID=A0ABT3III3_9BACT|nr:hypothetical protein [Chitinophaga nivalis]MCW3466568.1 hypothetical protein [Chitinophaga nivalis]MCW3483741.1 hypothetical protein [Chitinophaga nivalis]